MADKEARDAAIRRAAKQVERGGGFVRRAGTPEGVEAIELTREQAEAVYARLTEKDFVLADLMKALYTLEVGLLAVVDRGPESAGGFHGLTRLEIEATLSASEGMADLPRGPEPEAKADEAQLRAVCRSCGEPYWVWVSFDPHVCEEVSGG